MNRTTGIAILGATGSIGRSALAVLAQHPARFRAVALTARHSGDAPRPRTNAEAG